MGSKNRYQQPRPFNRGQPDGLQPGDSVGNRRSFREIKVPADDVGNRADTSGMRDFVRDDIGNSVDIAPTHSLSGVMVGNDGRVRRRKEDALTTIRVGRYIVGGVNPLVNGGTPFPAHNEDQEGEGDEDESAEGSEFAEGEGSQGLGRNKKRRRKRKSESRDNLAHDESSERRLKRLFDFDEDDRFDYVLTSDPEQKRQSAEDTVRTIMERAGRLADVNAVLLQNENRASVLVLIDEKGAHPSVPLESRADNADKPMLSRGDIELTALNFIVNKIVNRYPNDRIRLAVLPKIDEEEYLKSFHALPALEKGSDASENEGDMH
jgi:hypothetical protein